MVLHEPVFTVTLNEFQLGEPATLQEKVAEFPGVITV